MGALAGGMVVSYKWWCVGHGAVKVVIEGYFFNVQKI